MQSPEKLRPSLPSSVVAGALCRPGVVTPAASLVSADSGRADCTILSVYLLVLLRWMRLVRYVGG
jgi:hypothetical protein